MNFNQLIENSLQAQTDKMIEDKLGSSNFATKSVAWVTGTVVGPVISFLKRMVLILL